MSGRAEALARQFEQVNADVIAFVEQCTAHDWRRRCPNDGRTIGVVAHHVAAGYVPDLACIDAFATGQPLPDGFGSWQLIDEANARHATAHADCTPMETITLPNENGTRVVAFIRGLSAAQLDRTGYFPLMRERRSTGQMIERLLIGHAEDHLADLRAATDER